MSETVEADDRGRIVIPREIREKHGDRYRIVELDDRIELIPLKQDPIEGLRKAVGDAFDGESELLGSSRAPTVPLTEAEKERMRQGRFSSGVETDEEDIDETLYK